MSALGTSYLTLTLTVTLTLTLIGECQVWAPLGTDQNLIPRI